MCMGVGLGLGSLLVLNTNIFMGCNRTISAIFSVSQVVIHIFLLSHGLNMLFLKYRISYNIGG